MMKLLMFVTSFILAGCVSINQSTLERTALVNQGMEKEKVLELLGTPGNRQFRDKNEAWQYCQTSIFDSTDKFVVIWFYDGVVNGTSTYTQSQFGMCESFFKTIDWSDA